MPSMPSPLLVLHYFLPVPRPWLMTSLLTLLRKQRYQMKTPIPCATYTFAHVYLPIL